MCDKKRYIFCEFNNVSLRIFMDFYYANNAYRGAGTDGSYYCRIIDYIKNEFRRRRILTPVTRSYFTKKGVQVLSFL